MRIPNFSQNEFIYATSTNSGLNSAMGLVSGSIASMGSGVWALPGLLTPESMTLSFAGNVGTVGLPSPWGLVTSGGVVVHAHGTQTGQDTTNYSVDFSSLIPSSGALTAYLAATVTQIQQNPYPLTGPPQGHPSFNPNFVPTTAYAAVAYSVALTAVTGSVDNTTTFELARTTLTAGQSGVGSYSTAGWQRAAPRAPVPAISLASGGILTLTQAAGILMPAASGLTSTLPLAVSGGGLLYRLANPSATTVWTVAASAGNTFTGTAGTPVTSIGIPPYGALSLWGNAVSGTWEAVSMNPLMLASLANTFTAPQSITTAGIGLTINGSGSTGANLKMIGNGSTTPSKTFRVASGLFSLLNDAGTVGIISGDDSGNITLAGQLTTTGLRATGSGSVSAGLLVGSLYSTAFDAGGLNIRTSAGTNPGAGFRNDGTNLYLLLSNPGAPTGGFNGLRPFTVNLANGKVTVDGTGAGTTFGGLISGPDAILTVATIGGVTLPGGGTISTPGAITSSSQVAGVSIVATNGNVTSNNGRLRAGLGAYKSSDPNAACILGDFVQSIGGSPANSYIYERLPDGTIIQAYMGVSTTGADFITFPNAFPGGCIEVLAGEGAPQGWFNTSPHFLTTFGTQQLSATNFALYIGRVAEGGVLSAGAGVTYRYIAIGF